MLSQLVSPVAPPTGEASRSSYGAAEGVAATARTGVAGRGGLSSGSAGQAVSSVF